MEQKDAEMQNPRLIKFMAIVCATLIAAISPYMFLFALNVPIHGWTSLFWYWGALSALSFLTLLGAACGIQLIGKNIWWIFGTTLAGISLLLSIFVFSQWVRIDRLLITSYNFVPRLSYPLVAGSAVAVAIYILLLVLLHYKVRIYAAFGLIVPTLVFALTAYQGIQFIPRFVEQGDRLNSLTFYKAEELTDTKALPFSPRTIRNEEYHLGQDSGKVVLLNFWATWCGPCLMEMPDLEKLHRKFENQPFTLRAASTEVDTVKVKTFIDSLDYSFSTLLIPENLAHEYHIEFIPTTFLIDKRGVIRNVSVGYKLNMEKQMSKHIQKLINE